jgi:hypothetical protein
MRTSEIVFPSARNIRSCHGAQKPVFRGHKKALAEVESVYSYIQTLAVGGFGPAWLVTAQDVGDDQIFFKNNVAEGSGSLRCRWSLRNGPDNVGTWMYYCHIVLYMQTGLMALYQLLRRRDYVTSV